jgi:hypothetical protein
MPAVAQQLRLCHWSRQAIQESEASALYNIYACSGAHRSCVGGGASPLFAGRRHHFAGRATSTRRRLLSSCGGLSLGTATVSSDDPRAPREPRCAGRCILRNHELRPFICEKREAVFCEPTMAVDFRHPTAMNALWQDLHGSWKWGCNTAWWHTLSVYALRLCAR